MMGWEELGEDTVYRSISTRACLFDTWLAFLMGTRGRRCRCEEEGRMLYVVLSCFSFCFDDFFSFSG